MGGVSPALPPPHLDVSAIATRAICVKGRLSLGTSLTTALVKGRRLGAATPRGRHSWEAHVVAAAATAADTVSADGAFSTMVTLQDTEAASAAMSACTAK